MDRSTATRRTTAILLLTAAVLAGCGSAGSSAGVGDAGGLQDERAQDRPEGALPAASAPAESSGAGPGQDDGGLAAPIEQQIIKTGEVTVEVANVAESIGAIRAMATALGGYVGGSQAGTEDDSATLTLRIPAARFDEALAELRAMDGTILAEATREEDVTRQVVDLQARIANLEASEASYRGLVERAERIEDILAVQTRLDGVRGEIEQLQAQLDNVSAQAALSTLTVTVVPRAEPVETTTAGWDPGGDFNQALASVVGMGQGIVSALIWLVVVWVPVMAVLAFLTVLVWRGSLELRRRLPQVAGSGPTEDHA